MHNNVVKLPYRVTRRALARQPRASKNGTPAERDYAAQLKAEAEAGTNPAILGAQLHEFERLIRGMHPRLHLKTLGALRRISKALPASRGAGLHPALESFFKDCLPPSLQAGFVTHTATTD